MFHTLSAALTLGPRGQWDGLQDTVGLGREPDIGTIS
jgi:hypothetical protein